MSPVNHCKCFKLRKSEETCPGLPGLNLVYMRLFSAGDGRCGMFRDNRGNAESFGKNSEKTSVARRNDLGGSKDRRLLHYVVFCRPSSLKRSQPVSNVGTSF